MSVKSFLKERFWTWQYACNMLAVLVLFAIESMYDIWRYGSADYLYLAGSWGLVLFVITFVELVWPHK